MTSRISQRHVIGMVAGAAVLFFASTPFLPLRVNTSASMPRGIWLTSQTAQPYALVCIEGEAAALAAERHYLPPGNCPSGLRPLLKHITAKAGDVVQLDVQGVTVNGARTPRTPPLATDSGGRPLTAAAGRYALAAGWVWVDATSAPNSFDSRYFGPVRASTLIAYARPLLTE